MAVFRIHKKTDYTTIDNNIFKNKEMSYKATGLLCEMLSLPKEWDFSVNGLATLKSDKRASIESALKELESLGYLTRTKVRNNSGIIIDWQYDIYEQPDVDYPEVENPLVDYPQVENQQQLNTKQLNTNKLNTKKYTFKKPTLDEVKEYCLERHNNINPERFINFYESKGWMVGKNKMKDWKACVRTWEDNKKSYATQTSDLPDWFNKKIEKKEIDDETKQLIAEIEGTPTNNN